MKNVCLLITTPSVSAINLQLILSKIQKFQGIQSVSLYQTISTSFDLETDISAISTQPNSTELCIKLLFFQDDENYVMQITSDIQKMIAQVNNLPISHVTISLCLGMEAYTSERFDERYERTDSTQGSFYSNSVENPETYNQGQLRRFDDGFTLINSFMNRQQELKELLSPDNFCFSIKELKESRISTMLGTNFEVLEKYLEKRHCTKNLRFKKAKIPYKKNYKHALVYSSTK